MKVPSINAALGFNRQLRPNQPGAAGMSSDPTGEQDRTRMRLQSLRTKLQLGKPLAPSELEELKTLDPELYRKAAQTDQERRAYERSLRTCGTRSEASQLHNQRIAMLASGSKGGDVEEAAMRLNAMQHTYETFRESQGYTRLARE